MMEKYLVLSVVDANEIPDGAKDITKPVLVIAAVIAAAGAGLIGYRAYKNRKAKRAEESSQGKTK